jgi:nitrogen-specific signal transduction histidine kinase/ActR/RegA family two-component response regulator
MSVRRFDTQNRVRAVGIHAQSTEFTPAEAILPHQQEMLSQREKLAAMSSLLASMAHELNNFLTVIMIQSELLLKEAADRPLVERATPSNDAAERCVRIVRNCLMLARQHSPERTQVQLNLIIAEALHLCAYALRLDNIEVSQQLADDLPVLWADAQQLCQVVVNLLLNAHSARRETPTPRRLALITRFDAAHHQVILHVADTVPGIPPEIQMRLFEPFFITKPPGVGTGLGLSLCQRIIADHGGMCSVESRLGAGAIFRVTLPVTAAPGTRPDNTEPAVPPPITGKELLVIDDEAAVVKAMVSVFHRDGHAVDTAANGLQALAKLQERSYDLFVCDLHMPALDGSGLYRALVQTYPHLLPRLIFLIGDTLTPEAQAFLAASGAPYLAKPRRAMELRQVVQDTLQKLSEADCSAISHSRVAVSPPSRHAQGGGHG